MPKDEKSDAEREYQQRNNQEMMVASTDDLPPMAELKSEATFDCNMDKPKQKQFTVEVEIPEPKEDGTCNFFCPLWHPIKCCRNDLNLVIEEVVGFSVSKFAHSKPGPKCPRYKGEDE